MKILNKIESSKALFVVIQLGAGIYFFLLNCLTPLMGDDFIYQNIFSTEERVRTLGDIVTSQSFHYVQWGGRSVVHAIDQFFLMYDKMFFNAANTIIFLLFAFLIYRYVYSKQISNSFLMTVYIFLWFCIPGVGSSIIWQTMSCNYLWGTTIILAFFYPYRYALEKNAVRKKIIPSIFPAAAMLVLGILAGWTIEAGGAVLLAGISLIIIYQIKNKHTVGLWEITGFIGTLAGYGILILAPGNYARSDSIQSHNNFFIEIGYRLARETYYMIIHMGILIFGVILLCVVLKKGRKIRDFIVQYGTGFFFLFLTMVGIYVMTAAAGYAERVLVTPVAFCLIAFGCLFKELNKENLRSIIYSFVIFGCVMMCVQGAAGIYKMRNGDSILDIRTEYTSIIDV